MRETATATVEVGVERVWEVVADHEGMSSWLPGLRARVIRDGTDERNGAGAVRKVGLGVPGPIVEVVEVFEPHRRLVYRALAGVPLEDYRGEIVLRPSGNGTEIVYAVTATPRLPFGEALIARGIVTVLLAGLLRGVRAATGRP